MQDYHLIIKIPIIAARDDAMARKIAARIIEENIHLCQSSDDIKLQAIYKDKSPRGIPL